MSDFQEMRRQVLSRLVAGEIDREEYDSIVSEIDRIEGDFHATPRHSHSTTQRFQISETGEALQPGVILGNYRIDKLLGQGGMGKVWLAWEDVGEFYVVIKQLPPLIQSNDGMRKLGAIFHRVRLLQHQHICPVYTMGFDHRFGFYFVMKYIEGVTLAQYRKLLAGGDPLNIPRDHVMSILRPIAEALDYSHSRKVIHRDVKPQNIMIGDNGQDVQVVDFGLAAQVRTTMSDFSEGDHSIVGTPSYMSPEQWSGDFQDGRTDQYGLAAVAYELLAGHPPFTSSEFHVICNQILNDPVPTISTESSEVNDVLQTALSKDREKRFDDCKSFVLALKSAM